MELLESVGPRPRQARYQAALRPDSNVPFHSKSVCDIPAILQLRAYGSCIQPRGADGSHLKECSFGVTALCRCPGGVPLPSSAILNFLSHTSETRQP